MLRPRLRRVSERRRSAASAIVAIGLTLCVASTTAASLPTESDLAGDLFTLSLRSRVESPGLGGACRVVERRETWAPKATAVIVCDMWDLHHCLNATRRVNELAPRMNEVLTSVRGKGGIVIHAPSSCMDAYKGHPARNRARETPRSAKLPAGIGQWCKQVPAEEKADYPVDQREGGEDDDPAEHARWAARLAAMGRNPRAPWKSETSALTIDPENDYISDDGEEIWSVLEKRGIEHVLLMGVHLNMCVLGRPFGLRQLARNGRQVVLMRDMTDTMYDPRKAPFVSHFSGTDRMVEHVERYVCPTTTSAQIVGGQPFRFQGDRRPHVVFLVAEDEYKTETTLPPFARSHLGKDYRVSFVFDGPTDKNDLPGLTLLEPGRSVLDDADLAVVSVRRRVLPTAQLAAVRRYVASGKPIVGIRTASHAFSGRDDTPAPDGHDAWPRFDAEVLGGHYTGHYPPGPKVEIRPLPGSKGHPILRGVVNQFTNGAGPSVDPATPSLAGHGSLYKVSPLASSATPILIGTIPGPSAEPVLWTNLTVAGGRVVYTSLGHVDDFKDPSFQRLLRNAIDWAVGRDAPAELETASTESIAFPK